MRKVVNRTLMSLLVMVVMVMGTVSLSAADVPSNPVVQAAKAGLRTFFPDGQPVLGFGFRVYTINSEKMNQSADTATFSSMVVPTGTWRFVVLSHGEPLGLLTVQQVSGEWQAVSAGAAELASEIYKTRATWTKQNGFEFRFVRVYEAVADFMEISTKNNVLGFVPLVAARMSLKLDAKTLDADSLMLDSEIINPIRYMVKQPKRSFSAEPSVESK